MIYYLLLLLLFFCFPLHEFEGRKLFFLITCILYLFQIFITEFLSFFNELTITNIRLLTILWFFLIVFFRRNSIVSNFHTYIEFSKKNLKLILFFVLLFIWPIFTSLLYAPINEDANFYALPRIVHWLSNNSLSYYYTPIVYQISNPIGQEISLLFVYSTFGSLNLLNSLQIFYSFFLVLLIFDWIKRTFGYSTKRALIISAISVFSVSSVYLNLNLPKNDVILTYFIVIGLFSLFSILNRSNCKISEPINLFLLSVFAAIQTKGTSYIYISVFCFLFFCFVIYSVLKNKIKIQLLIKQINIWVLILSVSIVLPYFYRNYNETHNFSGKTEKENKLYVIRKPTLKSTLANSVKFLLDNILISKRVQMVVKNNINLDSNNTNDMNFDVHWKLLNLKSYSSSLTSSNLIVIFLFFVGVFMIIVNIFSENTILRFSKKRLGLNILLYFVLFSFLLFFIFFKYQPWQNRFFNPILVVINLILILKYFNKRFFIVLLSTLVIVNLNLQFIFNDSQPIIPVSKYNRDADKRLIIKDNYQFSMGVKYKYYGVSDYDNIRKFLNRKNCKIAFLVNHTDMVFPFMRNFRFNLDKFTYLRSLKSIDDFDIVVVNNNLFDSQCDNYLHLSIKKTDYFTFLYKKR